MSTFEEALQKSVFGGNAEKTFIDKLLAKEDIEKLRVLVKKSPLSRGDLVEILYLMQSSEAKLLNLSEWSRHVLLKFFVWLRETVKVTESIYDYEEVLKKEGGDVYALRMHTNAKNMMEHNIKFLLDLYHAIARTSLSIGATGFMELLKNKFEMAYMQPPMVPSVGGAPLLRVGT